VSEIDARHIAKPPISRPTTLGSSRSDAEHQRPGHLLRHKDGAHPGGGRGDAVDGSPSSDESPAYGQSFPDPRSPVAPPVHLVVTAPANQLDVRDGYMVVVVRSSSVQKIVPEACKGLLEQAARRQTRLRPVVSTVSARHRTVAFLIPVALPRRFVLRFARYH
jgi:hypothetical protein